MNPNLRQAQALETAQKAAQILKDQFHATRVLFFGSLARHNAFTMLTQKKLIGILVVS
jgi:predicted nucleotidyltransferase